jgi:hypothetical protein
MSKLLNIFMLLLILALICPASLPVQASTGSDSTLLQYTSGGHVLGFSEGEFYVATGDHALKVEFVKGLAVQPVAESAGSGQNAAPLDKVTYNGIWKDIDIIYTSAVGGIAESTYYLNTPASVDGIRLRYNRPISLDGQGNLVISFENGNMVESAPVAWQETGGQRTGVQANYVIYDEHEIGFALAGCRPGVAVTIDPTLTWNTFLGSNQGDIGNAIAVDGVGNIYVTGTSDATWGNPLRAYSSRDDAFIARLNSRGVLQWNTFLGGDGNDLGNDIKLDGSGNICVAGTSDETWGSPARNYLGAYDAFAAKLNSNGVLLWNSFLGSSNWEFGQGIAADAAGNVYVTGYCFATWGSPVRAFSLGSPPDGFAAKLDGSGNLTWNTFLGGSGNESGNGVAIDASGIYIAGQGNATWGSPVRPFTADTDGFAAKLTNGGSLSWNTFLGGDGEDGGRGVALDAGANVYVAGFSDAAWGSPVRAFTYGMSSPPEPHPMADAFVAKILGNAPSITSFTPAFGDRGTVVIITGRNFLGATVVSFGGVPATNFNVDSNTRITATVGTNATGKVRVTTPAGTAVSASNFYFESEISTTPNGGSSMPGSTTSPSQSPVILPTVSVRSASLSATRVAPGATITVTADVVNTSTVNGTGSIKVYVNGGLENSQGVTVKSGSSTPVTFTVSRNEPGTYSVYVGGTQAGSFTVDQFADPNMILYISVALILIALAGGAVYIMRRRQPEH